jgi:hypothetical protein
VFGWLFTPQTGSQTVNTRPTPKNPAQPRPRATPVGTQDAPVLVGQKPNQVPAPVQTQPQKPRPVPWWEADWAKIDRQRGKVANVREVLQEDLGRGGPKRGIVDATDYSDVIDVDFSDFGLQGPIHKVQLSTREGATVTRDYITESQADFVKPTLPDVALRVEGNVPRNPDDGTQVSPQFQETPVLVEYRNVVPQIR